MAGQHAGKYDNLMDLWKPVYVTSTTGQKSITWESYITEIPCQYLTKVGGDNQEMEQRVAYNTFMFKIRYPHSFEVLETYEIEYRGQRFKIDNVRENDKGREVELEITATKKDNE